MWPWIALFIIHIVLELHLDICVYRSYWVPHLKFRKTFHNIMKHSCGLILILSWLLCVLNIEVEQTRLIFLWHDGSQTCLIRFRVSHCQIASIALCMIDSVLGAIGSSDYLNLIIITMFPAFCYRSQCPSYMVDICLASILIWHCGLNSGICFVDDSLCWHVTTCNALCKNEKRIWNMDIQFAISIVRFYWPSFEHLMDWSPLLPEGYQSWI